MRKSNQSSTRISLQPLEVAPGERLVVSPDDETLFSITKPNKQPLPKGMLAVQENDRVILKYPDGTEIVVVK